MASDTSSGGKTVISAILAVFMIFGTVAKKCRHTNPDDLRDITKITENFYDDVKHTTKTTKNTFSKHNISIAGGSFTLEIPDNFKPVGDNWKFWKKGNQYQDQETQLLISHNTSEQTSTNNLENWKALHDGLDFMDFFQELYVDDEFADGLKHNIEVNKFSYSYLNNTDTIFGCSYYIAKYPNCTAIDFESPMKDSIQELARQHLSGFLHINYILFP